MKRTLAALAAAAAIFGLASGPAQASVAEVGWFTRNPAASAPDGGLQVANGLDGVVSFGAVRAGDGADPVTAAQLTLVETDQTLNADGASLQACPAAGTWKAGKGTLADGPKADCAAGSVELTRDAATGRWTGDVTSVLANGSAAIAVVPGSEGGFFQLTFDPPTLDVSAASAGGSGSSPTFDSSEFTSSSDSTSDTTSFTSGSEADSFDASDSFSSSPSFSADAGTTFTSSSPTPTALDGAEDLGAAGADTAAAADAASSESAAGAPRTALRPVASVGDAGGNRTAQFFFFLGTAAVIGTAAGFARNRLSSRLG